ncbi:MAG: hypothetical protein IT380_08040 [Myxococcales bacterium]|nr:hypothetical protein [Myxococcales bacterium]
MDDSAGLLHVQHQLRRGDHSGLVYQRLKRLPEAQKEMEDALAIQGGEADDCLEKHPPLRGY